MNTVFKHYSPDLAVYLRAGFNVQSQGRSLRFTGVRGHFDLHDVLAETFRKAFEERARLAYNGMASYQSYLRAIARNLIVDELRKQRPSRFEMSEAEAGPERATPQSRYEEAEMTALVKQFLAGLSPVEARLLTLRHQEGLPQEEVAARMRQSRRWVRTVEERLRRQLAVYLRGTGYLPQPVAARS